MSGISTNCLNCICGWGDFQIGFIDDGIIKENDVNVR